METNLEKSKDQYRRVEWVQQHSPSGIQSSIQGIYPFSSVVKGNTKKSQGDVVIVNLGEPDTTLGLTSLKDYLSYNYSIDKIETKGIYTNIYFAEKLFEEMVKAINKSNYAYGR